MDNELIMKVLYLFAGYRTELIENIQSGKEHDGGVWGMLRLPHYGVETGYVEFEHYVSKKTGNFLRTKVFGTYNWHVPFIPRFFSYDIVFTSGAFGTQFVFTVLKSIFRFKRPLWVMHDFSILGLIGKEKTLRQKLFAWMTARAGGIVTLGKKEAEMLRDRFPHMKERIEYIPYGVDADFFRPVDVPEERLVIAVGIDPDRDWKTFFKACEGIDARIIVTGSRRRTKDFNPPAHIEATFFERPELNELYSRATAVVIPLDTSTGVNDAMGVSTVYEAMVMGKAIVASRTRHMESYITDGENGLLVPEHDAEAMHVALQKLLDDVELRARLGGAAREYALRHLNPEKCTAQLAQFFKRLFLLQTMSPGR